jgi:hypothetical protein
MSGTMTGSELQPIKAATNPVARYPVMPHCPADWCSLSFNAVVPDCAS